MKTLIIGLTLTASGLLFVESPTPLDNRFGEEVRITSPVDGDVYVAGKKIIVDAPIRGDLVAAGATIIINDSVTADVLVAGADITINGYVGDDVRAAGGTIILSGEVAGDVLETSAEFVLQKSAVVHGNLATNGGMLDIFGHVTGDVKAAGDKLDFKGIVDGNLEAKAREMDVSGTVYGYTVISATTTTILPGASFHKDVRYWNDEGSINISPDDHGIKVLYDPSIKVAQERWELLGFTSVLMVLWYLGTALVVIWVIEFLFSKTMLTAAGVFLERSLASLGYGIVFFIGFPVFCLALAITILAIPIAVLLMIAYIAVAILATALTAIILSNWINRLYYNSKWTVRKLTFAAFGIFVVLKLFTLTPIIGPFIMIMIACMAIGAIVLTAWKTWPKRGAKVSRVPS